MGSRGVGGGGQAGILEGRPARNMSRGWARVREELEHKGPEASERTGNQEWQRIHYEHNSVKVAVGL